MKSKKAMLILPVVAVALCAVALIGAGFALEYTGTTTNTGNNVNSAYITLSLEDGADSEKYTGSFDEELLYNTQNDAGTIKYTLKNGTTPITVETETGGTETKTVVELGLVTVKVKRTDADSFTLKISDEVTKNGEYPFYMSYTGGGKTGCVLYDGEYTINGLKTTGDDGKDTNVDIEIIIVLYVEAPKTITGDSDDGPANPMTNAIFTFLATATTTAA